MTKSVVEQHRSWCGHQKNSDFPITSSYGGHYFSARQATWIDAFRRTLPKSRVARRVALGALIQASSQCAASPGHTAQPFQPTPTAMRFLHESWQRNVVEKIRDALIALAATKVKEKGLARKIDANLLAKSLKRGDLVFIDPPYSGVHYSRFYHVLESIALGRCTKVFGIGRYPSEMKRPRSRYSVQTEAHLALDELLQTIAERGAKAILTFPDHECSNGLSGSSVQKIAARHFFITKITVASRFSSLGGTSDNRGNEAGRPARRSARELVLVLNTTR